MTHTTTAEEVFRNYGMFLKNSELLELAEEIAEQEKSRAVLNGDLSNIEIIESERS